jgi:hypothetical protein
VNPMKSMNLIWLSVLLFAVPCGAQDASSGYSQSYAILIKGTLAGSETVTETTSESGDLVSMSDHEILVSDGLETKQMKFSTKMVLAKSSWTPISYAYKYTTGGTGDSYEVAVKNAKLTRILNRSGRTSELNAPAPLNMVIVDFNVYNQYDYLIRKYDVAKGGRQLFADFVPLVGDDISLALTYLGNVDLKFERGSIPSKNFKVEFVGIWSASLFVDADGRLLRLLIPAQDLEVVRKDLLPSGNPTN